MELKPGYKATDVGIIPNDWNVARLGEIGEALIGLTYELSAVSDHGTLVLRSSNIQNGALSFEDNVFVDMDVPERIKALPGDVLICVRNGSRQLIGKSVVLDERTRGMTFGAFMAVHRSPLGRLVAFNLQSEPLKRQISEHLGATINQITNKSLKSFVLALPPTAHERDAIAEALSDADASLDGLDRLIAKKRDLKQAAMQQLLLGQTRLPGFSAAWRAGTLASVIAALDAGVSVNSDESSDGGPRVLKTSCVAAGRFLPDESKSIAARDVSRACVNPTKGSLLISRMNTVALLGECGYVDRDYPNLFVPDRLWLTCYREGTVEGRWLSYVLASPRIKAAIAGGATGTSGSMKNLAKGAFLGIPISLPPVSEQRAIGIVLSDMDAELSALEARREKTRALKQGMMQELLTGRTRLI